MVTKGLIFSWSRFRLACGPSKEQAASFVAEELAGDRGKADIGHQLMKARGVRFHCAAAVEHRRKTFTESAVVVVRGHLDDFAFVALEVPA